MGNDGFNLADERPDLRPGVFQIGRNGLAVLIQNHELMTGAGNRARETKRPEFADELA
jgi:hypothetical protein